MAVQIKLDDRKLQQLIKAIGGAKVGKYIIADGVEYGVHQEMGERGHPSLRPAFDKVTKDLPKAVGKAIEDAVNPDEVIKKAAFDIAALWASDVNVDTGAYKGSIHVEED